MDYVIPFFLNARLRVYKLTISQIPWILKSTGVKQQWPLSTITLIYYSIPIKFASIQHSKVIRCLWEYYFRIFLREFILRFFFVWAFMFGIFLNYFRSRNSRPKQKWKLPLSKKRIYFNNYIIFMLNSTITRLYQICSLFS